MVNFTGGFAGLKFVTRCLFCHRKFIPVGKKTRERMFNVFMTSFNAKERRNDKQGKKLKF